MRFMELRQTLDRLGAAALGVAWLGAFAAAGCTGDGERVRPDEPMLDTGAFSHEQHLASSEAILKQNGGKALECRSCHEVGEKFAVQRPGSQEHSPCDTCHADVFASPPGAFCTVCHSSVDPLTEGKSPLGGYPRRERVAQLLTSFDHALHLDGGKSGGALDCKTCHQVGGDEEAYASFPRHAECISCHAPSDKGGKGVAPVMEECSGCHAKNGPGKARRFIQNDIRFTHGKHQKDKGGKEIACRSCHYAVEKSQNSTDVVLPVMADCARCHEDSSRTPDRVRISECGVCHTTDINSRDLPGNHTAQRGPLPTAEPGPMLTLEDFAPNGEVIVADKDGIVPVERGKMNPQVKPEDHTPIFRTRHGEAASSRDAKCGFCHQGVSGSPRDTCTDCHAVTRPKSHTLRFRTTEHGRQAASNARACATCHEVDFCTECHSIAPPNHSPLATFRYRHDRVARANPRSCMTCHTFEATCVDCHNRELNPNILNQGLRQSPLRGGSQPFRRLP